MGSTLAQIAEGFFPLHVRRDVHAAASNQRPRGGGRSVDLVTARSLANVGLAGLIGLPFLILASLVLETPLAGPAVIALGYLATANAIAAHQKRRAAVWMFAVFLGLVSWTLVVLLNGEGPLAWPAMMAALLAPVLAAAPALARHLILAKSAPAKAAALERAGCLNELAPEEAVLFLDGSGSILTVTKAGLRCLDLPPQASGGDVMRKVHLLDRPALLAALTRSRSIGAPVDIGLRLDGGERTERAVAATIAADVFGAATVRLREIPVATPAFVATSAASNSSPALEESRAATQIKPGMASNVGEAIAFALQQVGATATANGVTLISEAGADVMAACDPRTCRRIVSMLAATAVSCSVKDGTVRIAARSMSHATLLRISLEAAGDHSKGEKLRNALSVTSLGDTIDRAEGSIIVEDCDAGVRVSVRLSSAGAARPDHSERTCDKGG